MSTCVCVSQTADLGMTETSGENAQRFEIWFRRRTSKNHTYILQAASSDIKHAWTSDIARILWQQATRNKGESEELHAVRRGSLCTLCYILYQLRHFSHAGGLFQLERA